ncbi:FAD dependent oxidoreductase [Terriglobus saanensis SP1PR4]|uniref:FAD dependent oxidoreductase n=2 Tax=Terriglobus saanensis TaxID=870903 RepID=E8V2B3_TERSS|nr:FAD dependent oxidoreductase [Terriglobus saanensis SP1PR4]
MEREAVVIGGGLAGAAAATQLARAGRDVLLLERTRTAHHKVCGEFLSREALHYLALLGMDPAALGAVPITGVRLAACELLVETALPFMALSLTRRTLDEAILRNAEAAGVEVQRSTSAAALSRSNSAWDLSTDQGESFSARNVFLATGKHDLRGWLRSKGWHNDLVALKMYFRLSQAQHAALSGFVELILFPGGYTGLQAVENGEANLCLLITRERLRRLNGSWEAVLEHACLHSSHLRDRLSGSQALLDRPLALSSIPYGYRAPVGSDGVWRLGDQTAVIPSFSGDGMSIALHSAHLATKLFLTGNTSNVYQQQMRRQLGRGICVASALSQLLVRAPLLAQLVRVRPRLLRDIAILTRIPESAIIR